MGNNSRIDISKNLDINLNAIKTLAIEIKTEVTAMAIGELKINIDM